MKKKKNEGQIHIYVSPEMGRGIRIIANQKGVTIKELLVDKVNEWFKDEIKEGNYENRKI